MKSISRKIFLVCAMTILLAKTSFAWIPQYLYSSRYNQDIFSADKNQIATSFMFDYSFRFPIAQENGFVFRFYPTVPMENRQLENYVPTDQLPFFCSMEYKMQNKLNFWVKFRAGTDADYMKSIKVYHQFDYH